MVDVETINTYCPFLLSHINHFTNIDHHPSIVDRIVTRPFTFVLL